MLLPPTSYRLLSYRKPPAAAQPAPMAPATAAPAVAQVQTSLETLLKAIRDEALKLQASWQSPTPRFTLPDFGKLLDGLLHPSPAPKPATPSKPKPAPAPPKAGQEPATRLIAEQAYSRDKNSSIQKLYREESKRQRHRAKIAPGVARGPHQGKDTKRIREIAASSATEKAIPAKGFKKTADGWQGPTLHNPNTASGRFDPYAYQPRWIFDAKEDSFPIRPDYDKSGSTKNDLKTYQHGVVGGDQPLEGAFTVAKKGEYTVLTYSLNYVDNKFTNYHAGDSSTVSIYLKPNKQGQLEPAYVYTSFHYAGRMVAWKDVQKDAQGRPVIRVERGSHALHPYGTKEKVPKDGLQITANGQATLNGKALPNRMTWLTAQKNIDNARYLDPDKGANRPVWSRYFGGYPERREPFHPSLFKR